IFLENHFSKFQSVFMLFNYVISIILNTGRRNNAVEFQPIAVHDFINIERRLFVLNKNTILLKLLIPIIHKPITFYTRNFLLVFIAGIYNMQKRKGIVPQP